MNLSKILDSRIDSTKKVEDGFSGYQDIWGLMEDNIDYSDVINPQDEGDVYAVRLYGGDGHLTDLYCVNATDNQDAIDKVFDWVYENDNDGKELIGDWRGLSDYVSEFYTDEGGDLSDTAKFKEYFDEFVEDNFISNSDGTLFAFATNFFVGKVPQEQLNKKVSDSTNNDEYYIRLLGRLQRDCDYYLGNGGRASKHLWANDEESQIKKMVELWEKLDGETEWLTWEELEDYSVAMTGKSLEELLG